MRYKCAARRGEDGIAQGRRSSSMPPSPGKERGTWRHSEDGLRVRLASGADDDFVEANMRGHFEGGDDGAGDVQRI